MAELDLGVPGLTDFVAIGSGGFAAVYSANEADAGRHVAVKVLRAVDARARERFDRERKTLGMMTEHPNIVTMFRSGFTDRGDHPYLVMEYMPGGSLQDRLDHNNPMAPDQAVELIAQITDALGFAHGNGIVHKDVKPANILLSRTGAAKLTDFGISAVRDATGTSQMGFSLAYASPETFQATAAGDGRFVDRRDERSDLYSLAATLYALLSGTPPFAAETQANVMHRILTEQPRPLGRPYLDRFFVTALAKDPADRFSTAAQFSTALRTSRVDRDSRLLIPPSPSPFAGAAPAVGPPSLRPGSDERTNFLATADNKTTPSPVTAVASPPTAVGRSTGAQPRRSSRRLLIGAAIALSGLAALAYLGLATTGFLEGSTADDSAAASAGESTDADRAETNTPEPVTTLTSQTSAEDDESADSADQSQTTSTQQEEQESTSTSTDPTSTVTTTVTSAGVSAETDTTDDTVAPKVAAGSPALAETPSVVVALSRNVRTNDVLELSGGLFASADFDTGVRIWDRAAPGETVATYTGHGGGVTALAGLSGGLLASGGTFGDGTIHIWDPTNPGTTIASYTGHQGDAAVTAIRQLSNGLVASGDARGSVQVWDPTNPGATVASYTGHTAVIITEIIQLDNGLVLSNGEGDGAHVWDVASPGTRRAVYSAPGSGPNDTYTYEVVELDDGSIASATLGGVVHVWAPERPTTPVASYTGHTDVRALLALDGGLIASGGDNGQVHIWDPADPTNRLLTYDGHQGKVVSIVELGSGLLASTASNEVHIWNPYAAGG